jgi:hypothetical protein
MTKRGKTNAQKPAANKPTEGSDAERKDGAAPAPEAVVDGSGGAGGETGGMQHPAGTSDAPGGTNQPAMGEVVSDGPDTGTIAADAGGTTPDGGEGSGAGSIASDAEGRTDGAGDVDGGGETLDDMIAGKDPSSIEDAALSAASDIYQMVMVNALYFDWADANSDEMDLDALGLEDAYFAGMAACIRDIGTRATADVIGHQMKILGFRKNPVLSRPEAIAVRAFAGLLMDLDAYLAEEKAKAEAAAKVVEPGALLPIEDTTMEPTTEPMETWR